MLNVRACDIERRYWGKIQIELYRRINGFQAFSACLKHLGSLGLILQCYKGSYGAQCTVDNANGKIDIYICERLIYQSFLNSLQI
jgi:hypothetical protein